MKFSIIIPVRSINTFMHENIAHLQKLDYAGFEVVIVLDNPEAFDFESDSRFRLIAVGAKGPGEKRNIGASMATGEVLAFLDDDAYPAGDWLSKAAAIFKSEDIYALGGPAMTPPDAGFLEKCSGYVLESPLTSAGTVYRHIPKKRKTIDDYPTVNLFVKKEAFDAVGGFTMEFWPGEDTKLCLDLVKKFGRGGFIYDPEPVVYHHRRNLFRPHLKQISRYGMHRGQFTRIFPENSRLPSYFVPSAFVVGLLIGPIICALVPFLWTFYFAVLGVYCLFVLAESVRAVGKPKSLAEGTWTGVYVGVGIVLTHLVYGSNFLLGLIKRPKMRLKRFDSKSGNYVEG